MVKTETKGNGSQKFHIRNILQNLSYKLLSEMLFLNAYTVSCLKKSISENVSGEH